MYFHLPSNERLKSVWAFSEEWRGKQSLALGCLLSETVAGPIICLDKYNNRRRTVTCLKYSKNRLHKLACFLIRLCELAYTSEKAGPGTLRDSIYNLVRRWRKILIHLLMGLWSCCFVDDLDFWIVVVRKSCDGLNMADIKNGGAIDEGCKDTNTPTKFF